MKREATLLILILILAVALRAPHLNDNFSGDEIDLVGPARHFVNFGDILAYNSCGEKVYNFAHPPVRLVAYVSWAMLFGYSSLSMRMIPFIFGMLTIVAIYFFTKKLFGQNAALFATLLAAISRYDIFASDTIATDTGILMFAALMSVLFFQEYIEKQTKRSLILSFAFFAVALLTKFSALAVVGSFLIYGLIFNKNKLKDIPVLFAFVAVPIILFFVVTYATSNAAMFNVPVNFALNKVAVKISATDLIYDKLFKIATITWQATPFLAALAALAVFSLYRNKKAALVSIWLVITFLFVLATYGLDAQRNFLIALPAIFILAGKYISDIKIEPLKLAIAVLIPAAYFIFFGVSDLSGYYEPILLVPLYALAVLYAIPKDRKLLLLGGVIAMTIFIFVGNNYVSTVYSNAVGDLSTQVKQNRLNYTDVWSSKDIAFYMTPDNQIVYVCEASLSSEFIGEKNVTGLAVYSLPHEDFIKSLNCTNPYYFSADGHTVGTVCKISKSP